MKNSSPRFDITFDNECSPEQRQNVDQALLALLPRVHCHPTTEVLGSAHVGASGSVRIRWNTPVDIAVDDWNHSITDFCAAFVRAAAPRKQS